MQDLQFHRAYEPVPQADVAAFEARIGVSLPNDLREYLLIHGGGSDPQRRWLRVEPNDFYRGYNREGWVRLHRFERFVHGPKNTVDAEVDAIYTTDTPSEVITHIPVGSDSGNLFLIAVRGATRGSMWWGTREAFWEAGLVEGTTLCPAAETFDGFLRALCTDADLPADERVRLIG